MKRFVVHAGRVPALESHPEGGFVYYADARAVIDGLQALLNERDERLGKATELLRDVSEYTRHPDYDWFPCDADEVAKFLSSASA